MILLRSLKDSFSKIFIANFRVTEDYRERVLIMSNNSEGFIKGQLELINAFGFRWGFPINPSVPDSILCVGSRWRQIGVFRFLRRNSTRVGDTRMSLLEAKAGAAVFLSLIVTWTSVVSNAFSQLKKLVSWFSQISDFENNLHKSEKSKNLVKIIYQALIHELMNEIKRWPDVWTLFRTFFDLSKSKNREMFENHGTIFF